MTGCGSLPRAVGCYLVSRLPTILVNGFLSVRFHKKTDWRRGTMVASSYTVAFEGVEARLVEVQCAVSPGSPYFALVGLPDKAVTEAKERVRALDRKSVV